MTELYSIVVLYNISITESTSCTYLRTINYPYNHVIVVDNSTIDNNNDVICKKLGWTYISMNGNKGLSKAYNKALDSLRGKQGCVIWFDDDTNVTREYFVQLQMALAEHPECSIFVPVIQGQDKKFWSPNEARFFKNKQLKKVNQSIQNSKFNAINSCTAVRLDVYKNYRYDERLFLDQIDHSFFRDQRRLNRKFYKLPIIIQHNFSLKNRKTSIDSLKKRYEIMIPDFLTYCGDTQSQRVLAMVKVFGWGVRESIKYKDWSFLIWCIKKAIETKNKTKTKR